MPRLILLLLMQGASLGCAMAALGLVLYAGGPSAFAAAQLFGALGFVGGLLCGGLHQASAGRPAPSAALLPAPALASLLRQTLTGTAVARTALPQRSEPAAARGSEREPATDRRVAFSASVFGA